MGNGMRFLMVAPPKGQSGIVLFPAGGDTNAGGSFCTVFATDNCESTYADLPEKGVHFIEKPTPQEWGGIQAQFTDPDGNHFILIEIPEQMRAGDVA